MACLLAIAGCVLAAALWHSPSGGKVWGSRLVLPALPVAGVLVAAGMERAHLSGRTLLLALVGVLALWGFFVQIVTVVQDPAIALQNALDQGYTTIPDIVWSPGRNWLTVELRSLATWQPCNVAAYAIRVLIPHCGG